MALGRGGSTPPVGTLGIAAVQWLTALGKGRTRRNSPDPGSIPGISREEDGRAGSNPAMRCPRMAH